MNRRSPLLAPLVLLAALATAGCRSDETSRADRPDFPCTCGTPEAAVESCLHRLCAAGETNPDNPDCVCGTLSFAKERE
jgi:hypothetical protein